MDAETKAQIDALALLWRSQDRTKGTLTKTQALAQFSLDFNLPPEHRTCFELANAFAILLTLEGAREKVANYPNYLRGWSKAAAVLQLTQHC